ncbi:MAG TPA: RtcB family protein [Candidatus Wallbacteria bacterium]|nr:RtcB family protein [Candidatus Wallbacteria bacterium]
MKENDIKNIRINKITDFLWEIQPFGKMRVPCRIYATEKMLASMLRDRTIIQGMNVAALPGIQNYSLIMPDGHEGYGFPIGGVAALDYNEGGISPGGIGYDINCGVRLLKCDIPREEISSKISLLLDKAFKYCPAGLGSSNFDINGRDLDSILKNGAAWAVEHGFGVEADLIYCEERGTMAEADPKKVSETARKRGHGQMATLGSGNHFLEIQYVDEIFDKEAAKAFGITSTGQVMFMIHCGSRALGHQVCSDYIRLMEKNFPKILNELPDRELVYAPANSAMAGDYYGAMCAAANFAWCNRHMLAHQLRLAVNEIFGESKIETIYDVAHNIAKIERHSINQTPKKLWVHRKGATRAFGPNATGIPEKYIKAGQPVIIPGSMGTASYLLAGTAFESETFASTAHGAGRTMSRHEAIRNFRGETVAADLKRSGISVKGASMKGIAEEAGAAYKSIDDVISVSHNSNIGRRVARFRPIGVIKG